MPEFAYELMDTDRQKANIKVIGIGGGGGNAVSHMASQGIQGVDFLCANTDTQALAATGVENKLQIGINETKGLGSGSKPEKGRASAQEDHGRIASAIKGTDEEKTNMLFIAAGLGGGTGTGASPVVAEIAQELEILTVAVVTTPFSWEGLTRVECADKGIEDLRKCVDALILIPNDKLQSLGKATTMIDAFGAANDVLLNSVQGIAELITIPGLINLDFADVETVMTASGRSIMGVGLASGHDRGRDAIERAIQSPLLADINLKGARGILLNITAGSDLTVGEFEEIGKIVEGYASEDAITVVGTALDPSMQDSIKVTVVATGLDPKIENQSEIITDNKIDILDVPITKRNKDLFEDLYSEEEEEIDILDVPSFLRRTQA